MDEIRGFDPFLNREFSRAAAAKRLRLMVIDDNRAWRDALKASLSPAYEVICRPQGEDALKDIAERQPGLLILDVSRPGRAGSDLCQKIRAHPTLNSLPILFMTARQDGAAIAEGLGAGSDYFIAKPFEISALEERVEMLLNGQPSPN